MKTKGESLETIHLSLVNGQFEQMIKQIDEYPGDDFFVDYLECLKAMFPDCFDVENCRTQLSYFARAAILYQRTKKNKEIKNA